MSSLLIGLISFSNFPIIMTSWLLAIKSCHLTFTILRPYHPCRCSWAKLCGHHSYHHHYHHPYLTSLQPPWNSMSCWCLCHQQFLKSFDERCVLWALPWSIFWWIFLSHIFIIPTCLQPSASCFSAIFQGNSAIYSFLSDLHHFFCVLKSHASRVRHTSGILAGLLIPSPEKTSPNQWTLIQS